MKSKKLLIVAAVALVIVLGTVGIASAITNGEPDAGRHPYVALLVFGVETDDGFVPFWRCSGALIAPDVILTAGHCTDGATAARVWFDEGPVPWGTWDPGVNPTCNGETGYPCTGDAEGTTYTNPDFCHFCYHQGYGLPAFSYRDAGVIVLTKRVQKKVVGEYAQLPEAGVVDTLEDKTDIDLVGYGVQYQDQIPGKELPPPPPPPRQRWTGPRQRLYAPSELVSGEFVHAAEYMRLSMNPGGGTDGMCFGDSGGPDLLGGTDIVLAVNSYGSNFNCSGVGYSARVDIHEVLEWIEEFLH
ncbi:MAG: trypsin-like serine protease [Phycisphaerales bacterium]|nr:MAG: trypsin-like serine protease [Phycisphaerales bacterium]